MRRAVVISTIQGSSSRPFGAGSEISDTSRGKTLSLSIANLGSGVNAIIMVGSRSINRYAKQIVELALKNRLPSMFEISTRVEAGGLMSYSADDAALFRRAAVYVNKILKGTKPVDLPVEQPTKFDFVVNLKTAKQIDVTIPPNVLARADRVIR